jgi:phosphoserine aminotransferase
MLDWHGSGMSVMEMSHRGKEFIAIHAEAEADCCASCWRARELQGAVHAGRRHRRERHRADEPAARQTGADYVDTGEWSKKSIKEAKKYGKVNVAASGEAGGYTSIPPRASGSSTPNAAYVHICSNETIGGVEYHFTPDTGTCRWWPTCRRTSCRGRSTCRSTA